MSEELDYLVELPDESPQKEKITLAPEPLFATFLRQAIIKVWPDDTVMADFVNYVVQPLSELLGHHAAKGGNFALDMAALGKDMKRYSFDQSMRAHLVNGLLPVLHIGKLLKQWQAPQFRHYDDEARRMFMAGYIMHDWLKLPEVETALAQAGFNHADAIGPAQLATAESIFLDWGNRLGLHEFLQPLGGLKELLPDIMFISLNTQIRWGTLRNLSVLPRLKLTGMKRDLCEQLSRLADYLAYIARTPRQMVSDGSIRRELATLSNQIATLTFHHIADNRGVLTNFIHNAALTQLRHEYRVPLLYAPSGVVYLTHKNAPPMPTVSDLVTITIDDIKKVGRTRLGNNQTGMSRDGKGMKYASYYWLFFDLSQFIRLGVKAVFRRVNESKASSAEKRFAKMREGAWLEETVDLELPNDIKVDQLAEWCYLAEKQVREKAPKFEVANFLLNLLELNDLQTTFDEVPRDNRAGGVGYHWYFAAGHYVKQHRGLDPTRWQERLEMFAQKLGEALQLPEFVLPAADDWQDLRHYMTQVVTIGDNRQVVDLLPALQMELHRYQNAKRKGQGKTTVCNLCSASFKIEEQRESAVLFAPQVYSNKMSLHGTTALRNICAICGLEMMLRQILMNNSAASGGDFEGRKVRYLYFYPMYFFTPETLEVVHRVSNQIRHLSFTELRKQLTTGEGLQSTINVDSNTLQRLEPLLLQSIDPDEDRFVRMHFPKDETSTLTDESPKMEFSQNETPTFTFIGIPPASRDAKDAEAWVYPTFLALLLPLCLDVKIVASESSLPLLTEADELAESVFLDGVHAFAKYLVGRDRLNIDDLLPSLQRLIAAYLIHVDSNSNMGRGSFDYRWQDIPPLARNLATSPLYVFHYLKKWQRRQESLDSLPIGKAQLYLKYVTYFERSNLEMSHARELTVLYRQFYRAKKSNSNSILRPLHLAAKTLLSADLRLFDSPEALREVVFGELRRRIAKLQEEKLARYPKGSTYESREEAIRLFSDYFVDTIYIKTFNKDLSALRGKQLNLLSSACEAIYRVEQAQDWADRESEDDNTPENDEEAS